MLLNQKCYYKQTNTMKIAIIHEKVFPLLLAWQEYPIDIVVCRHRYTVDCCYHK